MAGSGTGFFRILHVQQLVFLEFFYKVNHCKKNSRTRDPKRNRTRVADMASDTHDHCTTATDRQILEFLIIYKATLSIIES